MDPHDLEAVRVAIYDAFARTGAPPADVDPHALRLLAEQRHLALDDSGRITMAHPFTTVPLGFSVMSDEQLWLGGCAWDSFALPHLLPWVDDVLVATRCPGCGSALSWVVATNEPPAGSEVAHFLVPTSSMWDDVVHTCGNQRLFCSQTCVDDWLERTGNAAGYVMDLATLWRLARGWYAGRLDHGYVRREPSEAKAYFREVGLTGSFWGLDA